MQPSTRAMIWHFWRQSRRKLLLLAAASVSWALFRKMQSAVAWSADDIGAANLQFQIFLLAVFSGVLFLGGRDRTALPGPYLLTLPLSTRRHMAFSYGFRVVTVLAACGAVTAFHLFLFGAFHKGAMEAVGMAFWQIPLFCIALGCLAHATAHLSAIKNEFRVVPMAIALEGMGFVLILPLLVYGRMNGALGILLPAVSVVLAWTCSRNALITHRHELQHHRLAALLEWFAVGRGRSRSFSSPGAALFWLGWRRYGSLFPRWALLLTLVGCTVTAPLMALAGFRRSEDLSVFVYFAMLVMVACAAFVCHVTVLLRYRDDLLGTGRGFYLALPVRSVAFVRGHMCAMLLSVLLVAAAGAVFTLLELWILPEFRQGYLAENLFSAVLAVFGLWLMLWFGLPIVLGHPVIWRLEPILDAIGRMFPADFSFFFLLVVIAVMLFFLVKGRRRHGTGILDLSLFFAVLSPFVVAVVAASCVNIGKGVPFDWQTLMLRLGLFLPVGLPIVAAPVLVDWIRHR